MPSSHSKYVVTRGEPYSGLPFKTSGDRGTVITAVTPGMAGDFLAHSRGNRRVRDEYVDMLARELGDGTYSTLARGNPFKFDRDGWFRDGHHTAFALIKADVTRDLGVAWGLTAEEIRQLDTNVDRSLADVFHIEQYANANELAALIKGAISWDHGTYIDRSHYRPTSEEIQARLKTDHDTFQAAIRVAKVVTHKHPGKFLPSALMQFTYQTARISGEDTAWFLNQLATLDDAWIRQNVYDPIARAYEDKLRGLRGEPLTRYGGQLALLCEAWNRHREGKKTRFHASHVLSKVADRTKHYFPVPK
jgi:hypothetical protein